MSHEKWHHVRINLADEEWGNTVMRAVADEYFAAHPDIADTLVVEVNEHAGWFLEFTKDGTTVGTANDTAVFGDKSKELRERMKNAKWVELPSIRRQHLVDAGQLIPLRLGQMLDDAKLLGTGLTLQKGQRIRLVKASNIPEKGKWYASPADGKWADGLDHDPDYSILLDDTDFFTL